MQRAFSLVELSIVLVILGLLTGGILAGQSLIRASELRSTTVDLSRYTAATYTFRDKYFALPGDMANAQSFWGVQHATPATCYTTASTSALTCNGDGNGQVGDCCGTGPIPYEVYRFWQHLANAGLIEGSYNGIQDTPLPGSSVPRTRAGGYYYFTWVGYYPGDTGNYRGEYGSAFRFAGGAVLVPEEAWNIDTKLDDGKSGTGKVLALDSGYTGWNGTGCTTSTAFTDYAGTYNLTRTSKACGLWYKTN